VALLQENGFAREDFARLHPGGALGRKLVVKVEEVMVQEHLPVIREQDTMREAIVMIAERRGLAVAVDRNNRVEGVLTAGDLSKLLEKEGDILAVPFRSVMTRDPKIARVGELASAVVYRMEQHGIIAIPVVDDDHRLKGVVHLHDLMRARVV
jgi:arabinose-5-phosphate isomerase